MFPTKELIDYRKAKSKRLQTSIKSKLLTVQKLAVKKLLNKEEIVFSVSSHSQSARLDYKEIDIMHNMHEVRFEHWDHMDYDYNDQINDFYKEQLVVVNHWLKILK